MRVDRAAFMRGTGVVATAIAFAACTSSGAESASLPSGDVPTHEGSLACTGSDCLRAGACKPGEASAQFRSQQAPPAEMVPGARSWASVTFDNCSGETWARGAFALVPVPPVDAATWGIVRADLPADVPNGAEVTIPIALTAPNAPGVYPFVWQIGGDAIGTLEEKTPEIDVTVQYSADCAQAGPPSRFRGMTAPSFVATGGDVHASVTFANCSTSDWTTNGGYSLGSQADQDNATWGVSRIPLPHDVASESQITIPIDVKAPTTPGVYRFAWKIVDEGKAWLDEATPVATITVLEPYDCSDPGPTSRFVREDGVPISVSPGDAIGGSETFANCGTEVWTSAFHVAAASPSNDGVWSAGVIALPTNVAPGYAVTVGVHGHAPGSPGTYPYRWSIVEDGVGPIDAPSPEHDVEVRCVPHCGDHDCGGDGCGGSCGSCGDGFSCDGAHCQEIPHTLSCKYVQWWNRSINYGPYMNYGWWDTDLNVSGSTPVQLRHDSRLDKWGIYGWGYMPEFTDMATGHRFRFLHLRPQDLWATDVGHVYPAGYIVGLSGGDTADTGLGTYSTGAHLCVQTLDDYFACFPRGVDPCQ